MPRRRANSTTASTQPGKPPWNDMPPFHSCEDLERMRDEVLRVVEQHVADAAAEDDAERDPHDEVVEVERPSSAPGRPSSRSLRMMRARIEPAEQDAGDIGERVPADRERADGDQHRIEGGKWQEEERHR